MTFKLSPKIIHSYSSIEIFETMLQILPIPAFKDNYIWLIIHTSNQQCLIVDPGEAKPVLTVLQKQNLIPIAILLTHHHYDHINGVPELLQHYSIPVIGPVKDNIATVTRPVAGTDLLYFEKLGLEVTVIGIPGHTHGHIAFYACGALFCGDTLFTAGCGRLFEGTAEQMYQSLSQLTALPDDTLVYCGHEYTAANLQFALAVEPHNPNLLARIAAVQQLRQQNLPTVPSTLALEKLTNPFLRCHERAVIKAAEAHAQTSLSDPGEVFRILRGWKDSFKG